METITVIVLWLSFLVAVIVIYATHEGKDEIASTAAKSLGRALQQALGILKKD